MKALSDYTCHKKVKAGKIVFVSTASLMIEGAIVQSVGAEWIKRHKPEPGGYFVVYEDGYTSYSPAKAFEEGYTKD